MLAWPPQDIRHSRAVLFKGEVIESDSIHIGSMFIRGHDDELANLPRECGSYAPSRWCHARILGAADA